MWHKITLLLVFLFLCSCSKREEPTRAPPLMDLGGTPVVVIYTNGTYELFPK
jgi:hypothetical protein